MNIRRKRHRRKIEKGNLVYFWLRVCLSLFLVFYALLVSLQVYSTCVWFIYLFGVLFCSDLITLSLYVPNDILFGES